MFSKENFFSYPSPFGLPRWLMITHFPLFFNIYLIDLTPLSILVASKTSKFS